MRTTRIALLGCLCLIQGLMILGAQAQDGLIASPEPGWPQWRGPCRDGISQEKGLLESWPQAGPKLLWKAEGLGLGYSSPIIVGDQIVITGDVNDELRVFCLDLSGALKWTSKNGASWKKSHPGARACCAYSEGQIFHMNGHGRVACLEGATGQAKWAVDTQELFAGPEMSWGRSECLLVDQNKVIVTPGGEKAFMAALDKTTGEIVWQSEPLPDAGTQKTSYASPILFSFGDRRLIVNTSLRSIVCVNAEKGTLCWSFPERSKYDANCATPVFTAGGIFHTIPSGAGGVFLRMLPQGNALRVKKAWTCRMDNVSGGAVSWDRWICGSGEENTGWVVLDAGTGEQKAESKEIAPGSVIYADGLLYCLSEKGDMALVKAGTEGFSIVSRFKLVDAKEGNCWAHPVLLDGRLYLRYHETLYCYDVKE